MTNISIDKINFGHHNSEKLLENNQESIINNEYIQEIINKYNLTNHQIKDGMNLFQKYINYIEKYEKKPDWSLILNRYGVLEIDFTEQNWFKKQKVKNNFWCTDITSIDQDINLFLKSKSKKTEALKKTIETFKTYGEVKKIINDHIKVKATKSLFIIDDDIINVSFSLKYIAFRIASESKTVAFLDFNDLYNFVNVQGYKIKETIIPMLQNVDYLFYTGLGIIPKPLWFVQEYLVNILNHREQTKKITYIFSIEDLDKSSFPFINYASKADEKTYKNFKNVLVKLIKENFDILKK